MMGIRFQAHTAKAQGKGKGLDWYLAASVIGCHFLPEFRRICFLPALSDSQDSAAHIEIAQHRGESILPDRSRSVQIPFRRPISGSFQADFWDRGRDAPNTI